VCVLFVCSPSGFVCGFVSGVYFFTFFFFFSELVDLCYASKNPAISVFFAEAKKEKDAASEEAGGAPAGVKAPQGGWFVLTVLFIVLALLCFFDI
jgi:hypothetical protein